MRVGLQPDSLCRAVADGEPADHCRFVQAELVRQTIFQPRLALRELDPVGAHNIIPPLFSHPVPPAAVHCNTENHRPRLPSLPVVAAQVNAVRNGIIETNAGGKWAAPVKLCARVPSPCLYLPEFPRESNLGTVLPAPRSADEHDPC